MYVSLYGLRECFLRIYSSFFRKSLRSCDVLCNILLKANLNRFVKLLENEFGFNGVFFLFILKRKRKLSKKRIFLLGHELNSESE